jgi:hypothetical protein
MTDKWGIHIEQKQEEERLSLKIHICIAATVKTKEILASLEITTDEKIHDGKEMKALVEHVLDERNNNKNIIKSKQF